ncbi:uncharacterized protein N7483_008251 [Penicillium malachiteum]|uniref:uncharacterized protein n=1 Tax=Penicillium malachiteum TaxID=1324776 RepID=UPI00254778FD|nr:uncharacterized protein N7483_008251 [Penicillium malachiteum]KAJ5720317.1 hypothetical protein N7483_008251 [Penicillium malachiteum]
MNALSDDSTADGRQHPRQRLQRALSLSSRDSDGSGSALSGNTTVDDPSFQDEDDELESCLGVDEGEQSPGNEYLGHTEAGMNLTNHMLEDVSNRLAAVEAAIQNVTDTGRKTTSGRRRSTRQTAQPRQ